MRSRRWYRATRIGCIAFCLRLVRDRSEAEDLFQQTWIHVAEKIRRFDPSRNFDAWLFTVARNLAIDHLRRIRPVESRSADFGR